jgi:hypothetical protein
METELDEPQTSWTLRALSTDEPGSRRYSIGAAQDDRNEMPSAGATAPSE